MNNNLQAGTPDDEPEMQWKEDTGEDTYPAPAL